MTDTICAVATASGRGGVGIVRVSGPKTKEIAGKILEFLPTPRFAHYCDFRLNSVVADRGIALFFPSPHSFTGEDVLELQGHGGPVILDMLVNAVVKLGARLARPGEFSERAYLNDKIDLAQAEAIADLINASSEQAAKQAFNTLQGAFSKKINTLVDNLIQLRTYVESAIDFPEEEIDFLADALVATELHQLIADTEHILNEALQGSILQEGMKVVIAGRPNAGKSSLLNCLAQKDIAIVTDIAGTTRDVLREHIHIDGMPLHIVDTAGLRDSDDTVEKMGIERARQEIDQADRILLIVDTCDIGQADILTLWRDLLDGQHQEKITIILNKIDESAAKIDEKLPFQQIPISAKTTEGIPLLRTHLKQVMGYNSAVEGGFSARRRHIMAIEQAKSFLVNGRDQLEAHAGELLAEDLRLAQQHLNEITGEFTADDLLGKIFSEFCIGK